MSAAGREAAARTSGVDSARGRGETGATVAPDDSIEERLARVRLVVLDVDGTLTDGAIVYGGAVGGTGDGVVEWQRFCVRDGYGLVRLREAGVRVAWITGRGCRATEHRAAELRVDALVVRSGPKAAALARVQEELGVAPAETLAMGDDLPDLALFERAAVAACPSDAVAEVRAAAHLVTRARGGHGAVREVCERVLAARGLWPGTIAGAAP